MIKRNFLSFSGRDFPKVSLDFVSSHNVTIGKCSKAKYTKGENNGTE